MVPVQTVDLALLFSVNLRRGWRCAILVISAFTAAGFFIPGNAEAFFPWNWRNELGGGGESHQFITTQAVAAVDQELFSVSRPTKPMKKALDEIVNANGGVDDDQFHSKKHFDGENFADGQEWVLSQRQRVIEAIAAENAAGARAALGAALHSIQDFYSHSNWVDTGHNSPSPALGRPGQALAPVAAESVNTCQDCIPHTIPLCNDCTSNVLTNLLTSGYYGGEDRARPHRGKCDHGGPFDSGSQGPVTSFDYGINKDSPDCLWSPRSDLHYTAASLAQQASEQFIKDFLTSGALTLSEMKLLLGAGPTLAIAIDTTGSMGPIIEQVKNRAVAIVDGRLGTNEEPSKYVLAPFSDPGVGPVLVTASANEFKNAIRALRATGGGDCPELAYTGMLQAIAAADRGGDLFVFTDASPKDPERASQVVSLASSKQIQINPFRFGTCSSFRSGQAESDPQWQVTDLVQDTPTKVFGGDFNDVAGGTGGQVFDLNSSEAGQITTLADHVVRSSSVNIASLSGTISGSRTLTIPLDSTLSQVTFSAAGVSALTLRRPNGSTVLASDPQVDKVTVSGGILVSIGHPQAGNWTAVLTGSGRYSLAVSGESSLDLHSVDFVAATGRPGHGGFAPIAGLPLAGTNQVSVALEGTFNSVAFELRRADGAKVADVPLTQGFGQLENERSGAINLPNESVVFVAHGTDGAGFNFERVIAAPTRSQAVQVRPIGDLPDLPLGGTSNLTFEVKNLGSATMTFGVQASDDRAYITNVSPASFSLGSGASRNVSVTLHVPAEETPGTSDTVTVVATSASDPSTTNFTVVSPFVSGGCLSSASTLCLGGGRFKVQVNWRDFSGNSGTGKVVPGGSADSGIFWFFTASNWELLVKVLDGCALNNNYWIFAAATTNVEFTLTVTDTETGAVKNYFNPLGHRADSITDTAALSVCGRSALELTPGLVRLDQPQAYPGLQVLPGDDESEEAHPRVEAAVSVLSASPVPAKSDSKVSLRPSTSALGSSSCVTQSISCNTTRTGTLSTDDCALGDGTVFDYFTFDVSSGTDIVAMLSSADFDTYLFLLNPDGATAATDDDSGEGTNSSISYHINQSGVWVLAPNNFRPDELGNYTLKLTCSTTPPPLPAAPTNLVATTISSSRVDLSWIDQSSNETEFRIETRAGSGSFTDIGSVPANSHGAQVTGLSAATAYQFRVRARNESGNSGYSNTASATTQPTGGGTACTVSTTNLCLNRSRFKVEVNWQSQTGATGSGHLAPLGSADSGIFWFFTADNWEMLIKILDGCGINNRYWVYGAATTTVKFDLKVTDTSNGMTRIYSNALGHPATTILDSDAFATCP